MHILILDENLLVKLVRERVSFVVATSQHRSYSQLEAEIYQMCYAPDHIAYSLEYHCRAFMFR
jgi:hypothetical protein